MNSTTWSSMVFLLMATTAMASELPDGFVRLSDIAPQIAQDIRYARTFNFTGGPVPGYDAAECILTSTTAAALLRVETRLAKAGYGLVVFDCYRPIRAVEFFVAWAESTAPKALLPEGSQAAGDTPPEQPEASEIFFPDLEPRDLIPQGYIARKSGHSIGHTVDLSLRRAGAIPEKPEFSTAGPCTADPTIRGLETGLDMGTSFDCFSPLSSVTAPVSKEARANRRILANAMKAEGFRGYDAEWWHFRNALDPARSPQNFSIE